MGFESVRPYVQLASGLSDLTRARAMEAAQGLLTLPAAGMATGTKMASQASVLADELLAAAAANRSSLQTLEEAQAEAASLREEVARLRSASSKADPERTGKKAAAAPRSTAKSATSSRSPAKKAGAISGRVTRRKVSPLPAPRLDEASSRLRSICCSSATVARMPVGL